MPRKTAQLYQDLALILNELESRSEDPGVDKIYGKSGMVEYDEQEWQAITYGGKEE